MLGERFEVESSLYGHEAMTTPESAPLLMI